MGRFLHLLFIATLFLPSALFGQNKIDSLKKAITTATNDSVRAACFINLAHTYNKIGQHDSGVYYGTKALGIGKLIKSKHVESTAYATIGVCYHFAGDYKNALTNYLASLKMEEVMDRKKKAAKMLNNIGVLYADQRFFDLAEKSYLKSYAIYKEVNDTSGIIQAGNNLGALYGNKSQTLRDTILQEQMIRKAIEFNTQTFEYASRVNDSANISNALANLGQNYMYLGNYKQALKNLYAALEIERRQERDYSAGISLLEIGEVQMRMKQYAETIRSLTEAFNIGERIQNPEIIKYALSNLSEVYAATGDWKQAFLHHRRYSILHDSLLNSENTRQVNEMQVQYETEKKEKENAILQEKNASASKTIQQQKYIGLAIGVICLLLVVVAIIIWRSNKQKQRINLELERKNILIERQKALVEEKQKEILDSIHYAKRIQGSLLTSDRYISRTLKRLLSKPEGS